MRHAAEPDPTAAPVITLVITELDRGGAENALVQLACGLRQLGWRTDVVSLRDEGPLASALAAAGISVTALHCGGLSDVRCLTRLRRHLTARRPQVLLSFLHQANLFGRLAAYLAGIPIVVSGVRVVDARKIVTLPERLTQRFVTQYIACSDAVAWEHARLCGIGEDRFTAILNGVTVPETPDSFRDTRRALKLPEDASVLLFVGRIAPQKGLPVLLTAFAGARRQAGRDLRLVVVGDGPDRAECEDLVRELEMTDAVQFLGKRESVGEFYALADVVVLPSLWEGTPNVLLESLASGTPVIATAVHGSKDIGERYPGVCLVPTHNIDRLTAAILHLYDDFASWKAAATQAQAAVLKDLTWKTMVQQYDLVLRELLAGNGSEAIVSRVKSKK